MDRKETADFDCQGPRTPYKDTVIVECKKVQSRTGYQHGISIEMCKSCKGVDKKIIDRIVQEALVGRLFGSYFQDIPLKDFAYELMRLVGRARMKRLLIMAAKQGLRKTELISVAKALELT